MSDKRRGLGRGLGALIPNSPAQRNTTERPVDVFFPGRDAAPAAVVEPEAPEGFTGNHAPGDADTDTSPVAREGFTGNIPPTSPDGLTGNNGDASAAAPEEVRPDQPVDGQSLHDAAAMAPRGSYSSPAAPEGGAAGDNGDLLPVPGAYFAEIPVASIVPNPRQPRQVFDEEALAELVHSIREIGVLQPVVVRRVEAAPGEATEEDGTPRYELVMGERRWRATQQAGLERVPAIVRDTQDDDLLRDALLENLHRSQLNPLEEAAAYQQLLDDFGCTHDELAQRIGRSRPQISNTLRLMKLPPLVQRRVAAGVLSAGHARALLGLVDAAAMERLAQRIVAEGLSVRSTEEIVALGGDQGKDESSARRTARPGDRHAALDELATRLSDRFDTRVKIALGQKKGRLTVEFATVEDLNRIVGVLAPDEKGVFRG